MKNTNFQAQQALRRFKYELASELGTNTEYKTGYWGNVAVRERLTEGGRDIRKLIASSELEAARKTITPL